MPDVDSEPFERLVRSLNDDLKKCQRYADALKADLDDSMNRHDETCSILAERNRLQAAIERVLLRHDTIQTLCEADEYELRRALDPAYRPAADTKGATP